MQDEQCQGGFEQNYFRNNIGPFPKEGKAIFN